MAGGGDAEGCADGAIAAACAEVSAGGASCVASACDEPFACVLPNRTIANKEPPTTRAPTVAQSAARERFIGIGPSTVDDRSVFFDGDRVSASVDETIEMSGEDVSGNRDDESVGFTTRDPTAMPSASARATAAVCASGKRSEGSVAHAVLNQASNAGGTSGLSSLAFRDFPSWMFAKSAMTESPSKGQTPVTASNATTPNAQMSVAGPTSSLIRTCSGDM